MASLTGKTISSTYDGLLKTTDDSALTSTPKLLTDGLGNSSGVAFDTTGNITIEGDFNALGGIKDSAGNLGTAGQVLASDGTLTEWIDLEVSGTINENGQDSLLKYWSGTQGEYDALTPSANTIYFIS
jgi:hypothetical protein